MILEIAVLLSTSLCCALIFKSFSQPFLLGYILTGVLLSPFLHQNHMLLEHLGHYGLLMLIFQIGIEFDLEKFQQLWKKSFVLFIIQCVLSFGFAKILQFFLCFDSRVSLLLTFLILLSSTAVVVKVLDEMNHLQTDEGSFIISVLILQDLAIIPITIIFTEMNNTSFLNIFLKVGGSILGLYLLMHYLSNSSKRFLKPLQLIFDGNQEIMTLASMAIALLFAAMAEYCGLAASYGTFLAGLILGSFGNRHAILDVINPICNMLMMLFFIYVGSIIDLAYLNSNITLILSLSLLFLLATMFINYIALRLLSFSKMRSFFISSVISQASEFSFSFISLLATSGALLSKDQNLLNTLCVISLTLGSVVPLIARKIIKFVKKRQKDEADIDSSLVHKVQKDTLISRLYIFLKKMKEKLKSGKK